MKNLTVPSAILLGFVLVALAHLFQPVIEGWLVKSAHGQIRDDGLAVIRELSNMTKALKEMRACRG